MNSKLNRKIIAIVGPTASGKTAIGVKLAKEFNGEIVSADSRQVFRGLDIGTAKEGVPIQKWTTNKTNHENLEILKQVQDDKLKYLRKSLRYIDDIPQWMIDIVEPGSDFNLFKYLELARLAIEDIFSRGKVPIIVGGTGLYVQGLVEGFHLQTCHPEFISGSQNQEMLKRVQHDRIDRGQLEHLTIEQLQKILQKIDIEAYEKLIDKKNPHRLIRAIERAQGGEEMTKEKPNFDVLQIAIDLTREILNQRIDKRVDDRFEQGMLGEVVDLLRSGVNSDWLISLGLEYRIITQYILTCHPELAEWVPGSFSDGMPKRVRHDSEEFEEMKSLLKLRSHQYAKRQVTWFKRFPEIVWEKNSEDAILKAKRYLEYK